MQEPAVTCNCSRYCEVECGETFVAMCLYMTLWQSTSVLYCATDDLMTAIDAAVETSGF